VRNNSTISTTMVSEGAVVEFQALLFVLLLPSVVTDDFGEAF
jgi:hypothetical protein